MRTLISSLGTLAVLLLSMPSLLNASPGAAATNERVMTHEPSWDMTIARDAGQNIDMRFALNREPSEVMTFKVLATKKVTAALSTNVSVDPTLTQFALLRFYPADSPGLIEGHSFADAAYRGPPRTVL